MKLCVVGTGYVAWWPEPASRRAATMSSASTSTPRRSHALQQGDVPIYEPGLEELIRRNVAEGRLTFSDRPRRRGAALADLLHRRRHAARANDGSADLAAVLARRRSDRRGHGRLPGRRRQEHRAGRHRRPGRGRPSRRGPRTRSTSCRTPSSSRKGAAIDDFMKPDRVVIGSRQRARQRDDAGALQPVRAHRAIRSWS